MAHDGKPQRQSLQARFGKISHATTSSSVENTGGSESKDHKGARTIKTVNDFSDFYQLGREVMPSTHSYMKVQFATRKRDGLDCVIKVRLKPNCFRSREDERQWRYNTEFLLNMPEYVGVAKLYEVLEDKSAFYIAMEKVSGMDLFETLEQEGNISVSTARDIVQQLLASLIHLSGHNAVHKDLKLENVMLESSRKSVGSSTFAQTVKMIDFDTLEEWTPNTPISKDVVGTDQYIAQEAYGGRYSPLSDIFSTGVIAYRLLTGKFPYIDEIFDDEAGENYVGSSKMAQIQRRLKVAKVDFSTAVFRENPQASDLVMRMLTYSEAHRPTAAAALEHPWFQEDVTGRINVARNEYEDLLDDGIIIAQGR